MKLGRLLLLLPLHLLAAGLPAQEVCAPGTVPRTSGEPPPLDEYRSLFQQGGVSFYARVVADSLPTAHLVIRNANAGAVEVSFQVAGVREGGEEPLGQRCVRISGGGSLHSVEGTTLLRVSGAPLTEVRVRNLSVTQLGAGAAMAPPPGRVQEVPSERPPLQTAPTPVAALRPSTQQYACDQGAAGARARAACTASYMGASARAAATAGTFSGTTRACLLEYAAGQERAAERIRAGDPQGEMLRLTPPACFVSASATWDFGALARACVGAVWTGANEGRVRCGGLAPPERVAVAPPAERVPAVPPATQRRAAAEQQAARTPEAQTTVPAAPRPSGPPQSASMERSAGQPDRVAETADAAASRIAPPAESDQPASATPNPEAAVSSPVATGPDAAEPVAAELDPRPFRPLSERSSAPWVVLIFRAVFGLLFAIASLLLIAPIFGAAYLVLRLLVLGLLRIRPGRARA